MGGAEQRGKGAEDKISNFKFDRSSENNNKLQLVLTHGCVLCVCAYDNFERKIVCNIQFNHKLIVCLCAESVLGDSKKVLNEIC